MQRQCRYGQGCWNKDKCKYFHPKTGSNEHRICRYGNRCRALPNCVFYHPVADNEQHHRRYKQKDSKNFVEKYQTMSQPGCKNSGLVGARQGNQADLSISISNNKYAKVKTEDYQNSLGQQNNKQQQSLPPKLKDPTPQKKLPQQKVAQVEAHYQSQLNTLNQIYNGQQAYMQKQLQQFFNVRLIKSQKFDQIYGIISDSFGVEEVGAVIALIERLEESEYGCYFTYLKFVRVIARIGVDYDAVCRQLQKELKIRLLKQQKQNSLLQKFPSLLPYEILSDKQLIQLPQPLLFLVDGDNIMNSNKILRQYYRNRHKQIQIEGQVRLRWLLSQVNSCILFFDYKKDTEEVYQEVAGRIMYGDELGGWGKQEWLFARQQEEEEEGSDPEQGDEEQVQQEDEEQGEDYQQIQELMEQDCNSDQDKSTADEMILNWLKNHLQLQKKETIPSKQLNTYKQTQKCEQQQQPVDPPHPKNPATKIILITADRLLIQKCLYLSSNSNLKQHNQISISSGKHFIKYCKQHIRRKYFGNKHKKAVIKRIFIQPRL